MARYSQEREQGRNRQELWSVYVGYLSLDISDPKKGTLSVI
jgi:hypothetical protein